MTEIAKTAVEALSAVLIVLGSLLCALSSLGLLRMPDFYTRTHAAGKASTLGITCVLLGAFLFFILRGAPAGWKLLAAVAFLFLTAPVASHMIGRAAYRTGVPLSERSVIDELSAKAERRSADE